MTKKLLKKTFTLVELIIVIAIIAILAVISFLWLNKRLGNARDASRSSNLANIDKALQIYLVEKTALPKPDNNTMLYASGIDYVIGYQGVFGETARDTIGDIDKAPKDGNNYFTYYVNNDLNKYQLMGYMENPVAYNPNTANAENYAQKYVYVRGDNIGILTDSDKNPLQDFGGTGFNVLSGENSYTAYFDNSTNASGTGKQLFTYYYSQTKSLLQNTGFAQYDQYLTGYWDMESTVDSGETLVLKGFGQSGLNGSCYNSGTIKDCGTEGPQFVPGKYGKSMQFDGIDDYVSFKKSFFNMNSTYSWVGWIYISSAKDTFSIYSEGNPGVTFVLNYYTNLVYGLRALIRNINKSDRRGGDNYANKSLSENQWYHVVFTFDGLTDNYGEGLSKYYLNGKLITKTNNMQRENNSTTKFSTIGANIGGFLGSQTRRAFNGSIDEVRIYNRALSDYEVEALYNATK